MNENEFQPLLFPELATDKNINGVVNVASVPQRSPFRYPGGKTWLVPVARKWFSQGAKNAELIEPFAGGGIISLTAAAEGYFDHVIMTELDDDIASVWQTIFSDTDCTWLVEQILNFAVTPENITRAVVNASVGTKEKAFATIVRNRTNHGGILAKGSGRIKTGEAGKGLSSRWYPETISRRIIEANGLRNIICFSHKNAFAVLDEQKGNKNAFFFIDPPYTVAGKRLYNFFDVDHKKLFEIVSEIKGHFLLTYDDSEEIHQLAEKFSLPYRTIPMQTTHLIKKQELIISDTFDWLENRKKLQYA